ncbi:MAG: diadenylate cyclase [Polyangiaceae bacterium]
MVEAATELARHRIGAIVAFEQEANLDEFVGSHKGHVIDAAVSRELLVPLFIPEGVNKLHDGAVIIRHLRIAKAGVFFPMPEQRVVDASFGSRHRAALGITEETDAVVVIVSEERGTISFCFNGNIASNLDGPKLRTLLEAVFSPKAAQKKRATATRRSLTVPTPPPVEAGAPASISADGPVSVPSVDESHGATRTRLGLEPSRTGGELHRADVKASTEEHSDPEPRPLPLRRGMESDPPPPLRSRAGLEDSALLGRIPRPAKVPAPVRTVLSSRDGSVIRTPVATNPTETQSGRDSSNDSGDESR